MRMLIAGVVLALVAPLAAGETRLGTGVNLKDATAIKSLIEEPAAYAGKTLRVDGVATAVCTHMGCWMAVAAEGDVTGATVRLKVDDGVIVFPVTAKGRKVSAEGVFEAVGGTGDSRDAAGDPSASSGSSRAMSRDEHVKQDPKASQQYQLKATGAVIQ